MSNRHCLLLSLALWLARTHTLFSPSHSLARALSPPIFFWNCDLDFTSIRSVLHRAKHKILGSERVEAVLRASPSTQLSADAV